MDAGKDRLKIFLILSAVFFSLSVCWRNFRRKTKYVCETREGGIRGKYKSLTRSSAGPNSGGIKKKYCTWLTTFALWVRATQTNKMSLKKSRCLLKANNTSNTGKKKKKQSGRKKDAVISSQQSPLLSAHNPLSHPYSKPKCEKNCTTALKRKIFQRRKGSVLCIYELTNPMIPERKSLKYK